MANINDFKVHLSDGGARANQFQVNLNFPNITDGIVAATQGKFLCNAASLPGSSIENISVPYRGKIVNFAGERIFEPWSVTIINETSFSIRSAFERWVDVINHNQNIGGRTKPARYQVQMQVTQLGRNGEPLMEYEFHDAYPVNIGEIALNYGDGATLEEFTVQFAYNYWVTKNTGAGAGNIGVNVGIDLGPFGTIVT